MELHLYTRRNCPLCDEAKHMLRLAHDDFEFSLTEIDIEEDDAIHEKYMLMIPVIEVNEQPVLYGKIDYIDIIELFEQKESI